MNKNLVQFLVGICLHFQIYSMEIASEAVLDNAEAIVQLIIDEQLLKYDNIPNKQFICKLFSKNLHQNVSSFTSTSSSQKLPIRELSNLSDEVLSYIFTQHIEHIFKHAIFHQAIKESLRFTNTVILLNKRFYQFRYILLEYIKKIVTAKFVSKKLLYASEKGDIQLICNLLLLKASSAENHMNLLDINIRSKKGFTPLILAVLNNREDIAQLFVKIGCDIDGKDEEGCTALMHAARLGYKNIVKSLLKYGANPVITNNDDIDALKFSISEGRNQITKLLLRLDDRSKKVSSKNKRKINVILKMLTPDQCQDYFGVDITSKGYCALEFNFKNLCSDTFILRPSYLNMPYVKPKKVAKRFHYWTSLYVTSLGVVSVAFFWYGVFAVSAMGKQMSNYNLYLDKLLEKEGLDKKEIVRIEPYESKTKIIFIRRDQLANPLVLKLFNETQKNLITFNYRFK